LGLSWLWLQAAAVGFFHLLDEIADCLSRRLALRNFGEDFFFRLPLQLANTHPVADDRPVLELRNSLVEPYQQPDLNRFEIRSRRFVVSDPAVVVARKDLEHRIYPEL
jgi:hypothetical protein